MSIQNAKAHRALRFGCAKRGDYAARMDEAVRSYQAGVIGRVAAYVEGIEVGALYREIKRRGVPIWDGGGK
jgi:hypothetical protein